MAMSALAYIVNHGVPDELVARVFAASARFHALPLAEKMAIALDQNHRGFIPIDTSTDVNSTLAEVTRPNQSESFMMLGEHDEDIAAGAYLSGRNQWPALAGFREDVEAYHGALSTLGRQLMEVAALAVGADPAEVAGGVPSARHPGCACCITRRPTRRRRGSMDRPRTRISGASPFWRRMMWAVCR